MESLGAIAGVDRHRSRRIGVGIIGISGVVTAVATAISHAEYRACDQPAYDTRSIAVVAVATVATITAVATIPTVAAAIPTVAAIAASAESAALKSSASKAAAGEACTAAAKATSG